jgi:hypothetical protein
MLEGLVNYLPMDRILITDKEAVSFKVIDPYICNHNCLSCIADCYLTPGVLVGLGQLPG